MFRHGVLGGADRRAGTSPDGSRRWPRSYNNLLLGQFSFFFCKEVITVLFCSGAPPGVGDLLISCQSVHWQL